MNRSRLWPCNSSPERMARWPAGQRHGRDAGRGHRGLSSLAALIVLAGAAAVLAPAAASGAASRGAAVGDGCVAAISVPDVSITQSSPGMFLWVQGTLTRACGASDAKWDAYSGSRKGGSWDFAGTTTASWPLPYGSGPVGHYAALPAGAVDAAGNPLPQVPAGFAIKFGSRAQIHGYRSSRYVHLRAHVSTFNWSPQQRLWCLAAFGQPQRGLLRVEPWRLGSHRQPGDRRRWLDGVPVCAGARQAQLLCPCHSDHHYLGRALAHHRPLAGRCWPGRRGPAGPAPLPARITAVSPASAGRPDQDTDVWMSEPMPPVNRAWPRAPSTIGR